MTRILSSVLAFTLTLGLLLVPSQAQQYPTIITLAPSTLAVTAVSAANAAVTLTLPAVAGQFHYLTSVRVTRTCTTAIAGTAALTVTSTNLPGALAWTMGNACPVGSTNNDVVETWAAPLKSSTVNTATTIVCPAIGATGICRINAIYTTGA